MRRLIVLVFIVITAFILTMTISSHKAREPDFRGNSPCFNGDGKYYTMEIYR